MVSRKPKPLPTPLAAALGVVPTVLDSARRLPGKAAQIPVLAVSTALTALETARQEYEELAARGERVVGRLRGDSVDVREEPVSKTVDTAASAAVVATVEVVASSVVAPEVTTHDALPLPDYDHMTLGSLRGRLRSLSVVELVQVRDYEKAHAHRLPVVTLLDNRIAKLATEAADSPSPAPNKTKPRTKVRTTRP